MTWTYFSWGPGSAKWVRVPLRIVPTGAGCCLASCKLGPCAAARRVPWGPGRPRGRPATHCGVGRMPGGTGAHSSRATILDATGPQRHRPRRGPGAAPPAISLRLTRQLPSGSIAGYGNALGTTMPRQVAFTTSRDSTANDVPDTHHPANTEGRVCAEHPSVSPPRNPRGPRRRYAARLRPGATPPRGGADAASAAARGHRRRRRPREPRRGPAPRSAPMRSGTCPR